MLWPLDIRGDKNITFNRAYVKEKLKKKYKWKQWLPMNINKTLVE